MCVEKFVYVLLEKPFHARPHTRTWALRLSSSPRAVAYDYWAASSGKYWIASVCNLIFLLFHDKKKSSISYLLYKILFILKKYTKILIYKYAIFKFFLVGTLCLNFLTIVIEHFLKKNLFLS